MFQKKAKADDGNKSSVVNFGAGWFPIIYCLLMFWFYVGMCNDGSNVTVPAIAANLRVENSTLLTMNSIAGLVGVVFFIVMGQINRKIGARYLSGILCVAAGVAYYGVCNASSVGMYLVFMCIVTGSIMSAGYICGGALVAQWFPKKKGVVMGYTTMGHNLGSAFYCVIFSALISRFLIGKGVLPISLAIIILGIVGMLFIRDTPQERHINPDNVSDAVFKSEYDMDDEDETGGWTVKKLLSKRELWLASITTGLFQICSVGVMSQLVLRNEELGFSAQQAMSIMTVLALIGVGGSFLIGVLDDKLGTKKTMIGFGIWYAAALILNFTNLMPCVYISLFMIAIGIGGSANFTTSLPTSVFGRQGFNKVNSVIFPIQGAVTAMQFLINAMVQQATGGQIRYAYLVFVVVAIANVVLISRIDEHRYNRDYLVQMGETEKLKALEAELGGADEKGTADTGAVADGGSAR
ncbi:permease of the major facilitator superfamily [Clostridium sp. SY8519]|uniref:MFS transporter n=1 Tax=Clostridium sp. (strain SY8519) TaxID=1042156 RepID=UPI0002171BD8|nr:MFS transporter [Clostridium sp. SY8519]BAK47053.1 permease of the major facilitator superfamily [Clostridium sp. SY8519]